MMGKRNQSGNREEIFERRNALQQGVPHQVLGNETPNYEVCFSCLSYAKTGRLMHRVRREGHPSPYRYAVAAWERTYSAEQALLTLHRYPCPHAG